jgi:DNA-binding NarL/FixJ family response regulator
MLRILLADRSETARNATKLYLSRYAGEWQVVTEADDEPSLLSWLEDSCPDVVVLHIGVAEQPLPDLVAQLRAICPQVNVIVASGDPDMETIVLTAGANAFLYLGNSPASLVTKLRIVRSDRR